MDDAEVDILLNWKERGRATLEENKLALAEMNAALAYRDALRATGVIAADAETVATQGNTNATVANAVAQTDDAAATTENVDAQVTLATAQTGLVIPAWLGTTAVILAASAALFPFVAVLGAAAVITTDFALAATAAMTVLGTISLAFLGIGAGVVLLANHFAWVNNSMGKLKADFKEMGLDLAQAGSKPANQILQFLDSLIPLAQGTGERLISWFGARLPNALTSMRIVLRDLAPDMERFGAFFSRIYDHVAPQLGPLFELFTRFGLGVVQGLLGNLVKLSDWFQQRLPTWGPVISQIFGGLGNAVQWVGTTFGKFGDWLVAKWPDIIGTAKAFLDSFKKSFDAFNIATQGLGSFDAKGFFSGLGAVLGGVVSIAWDLIKVIAIIVQQAVAALPAALQVISDGWTAFVIGITTEINNLIDAWNSLPAPLRGGNQTIPHIYVPTFGGGGGAANPNAGRAGGAQNSGATTRSSGAKITITVNGATSPQVTASTIARNLRKMGAV